MTASTLHVVVGESAAGALRQALRSMQRDDRVVGLVDDLTFGPINPADSRARAAWAAQELGFDTDEPTVACMERSWSAALAPAGRRIAWMSRRSASDFAGFLEFLWRLGDQPCEVVDLSDVRFPERCTEGPAGYLSLVISLGALNPDQIVAMGLLDHAVPLAPTAQAHYRDIWRRLRAENAPLRVVSEAGLGSAPITLYDDELMSYAVPNWRKVARIVGEALTNQEGYFRCGDLLLAARIGALANAGRLEVRGNPLRMRFSEVRLPAG